MREALARKLKTKGHVGKWYIEDNVRRNEGKSCEDIDWI
jgi:hypothetical protein